MTDRRRGRRDVISAKSNRSLSRFWASVLGVICCALVIIRLLGVPAHNAGKPAPRMADVAAQMARRPNVHSSASNSVAAAAPIPARNTSPTAHESITPSANETPPQAQDARVAQPTTIAVRITLPPDESIPGASASGRDQGNQALAIAQLSELDAEIAHRASDLEMLTMKRDQLQSQINELSNKFEQASRQLAGVRWQVSKAGKPMMVSRVNAMAVHRVFLPTRHRGLSSKQLQPTAREGMNSVKQLLAARMALVNNDSSAARDLLEAAQTSIVFAPGNTLPEGARTAAAQVTEALGMLNSGDPADALPCLDRAITALHPTF
jgi:hypothetical protein